jgi:hypothetical protein
MEEGHLTISFERRDMHVFQVLQAIFQRDKLMIMRHKQGFSTNLLMNVLQQSLPQNQS